MKETVMTFGLQAREVSEFVLIRLKRMQVRMPIE